MQQRQFEFKSKNQQVGIGNHLATDLTRIVNSWGFSSRVEILSRPGGDTFQIRIFRLDPDGKVLYEGTERRGIEFLKIEIKYPSQFSMSVKWDDGAKKAFVNCISERELRQKSKALLENAIFTCWSALD